jgi:hypothetical protein
MVRFSPRAGGPWGVLRSRGSPRAPRGGEGERPIGVGMARRSHAPLLGANGWRQARGRRAARRAEARSVDRGPGLPARRTGRARRAPGRPRARRRGRACVRAHAQRLGADASDARCTPGGPLVRHGACAGPAAAPCPRAPSRGRAKAGPAWADWAARPAVRARGTARRIHDSAPAATTPGPPHGGGDAPWGGALPRRAQPAGARAGRQPRGARRPRGARGAAGHCGRERRGAARRGTPCHAGRPMAGRGGGLGGGGPGARRAPCAGGGRGRGRRPLARVRVWAGAAARGGPRAPGAGPGAAAAAARRPAGAPAGGTWRARRASTRPQRVPGRSLLVRSSTSEARARARCDVGPTAERARAGQPAMGERGVRRAGTARLSKGGPRSSALPAPRRARRSTRSPSCSQTRCPRAPRVPRRT